MQWGMQSARKCRSVSKPTQEKQRLARPTQIHRPAAQRLPKRTASEILALTVVLVWFEATESPSMRENFLTVRVPSRNGGPLRAKGQV